jgi:DNA helicase-2/ATP-dependent DNA helicase PcrA
VQDWQKKPITASGTVGEFLEYLRYFREVGGAITMSASPQRDAVHLMTAHAAKGLEFKCVFILRANRGSFPFSYKEPLVEFPPALRDPDSVAAGESKQLFEQEERRLFYVAMTRARDSLTIHAKRGSGKKDPTPPGFLRPLLSDRKLRPWLRERNAQPLQVDLFGEEAEVATPPSGVNAWLKLEPLPGLHLGLSATAIQTYETCPLQFKLNREWRIPGEVPAATQYGAAMHVALRHYYDAVRFGQVATAATVLELFRGEFAKALVEDAYQRELYENQGEQQLRDFVAACERNRSPDVLHTEQTFSVKIGPATVNGRMDRVDRLDGDHVAIVDYKTGKPQSQEDADASLQLSIYALAARERWGYHVDRLVFHNLEDNSAIVTKRDDLELQAARRKVEEVAAKIQAGDFQAKEGFHCGWCGYRNLCPKTEKRYYTSPPTKSKTH